MPVSNRKNRNHVYKPVSYVNISQLKLLWLNGTVKVVFFIRFERDGPTRKEKTTQNFRLKTEKLPYTKKRKPLNITYMSLFNDVSNYTTSVEAIFG